MIPLQSQIPCIYYSQTYQHQLLLRQHRGHPRGKNCPCLRPFLWFMPLDNDYP